MMSTTNMILAALFVAGVVGMARKAQLAHGSTCDRWRGRTPLAVLLDWIARETGWDRFAVSTDRVLIEVGWSQAPLAVAWPWLTIWGSNDSPRRRGS